LVRWQHPELGLVPPNQFIPAAEKSGLIVEMGEWVLGEACRQLVEWKAVCDSDFVMAVNLSPVQFRRGNIESIVENALKRSGLSPQCLELEITESTLIQDAEKFMVSLQKIKALGVKISIDDFGTGYSNLSYLQRFAVDKLKIDQSFVRSLVRGGQDQAIVSAIIQMARSLNLSTTAEGIEETAIQDLLQSLGCDCGQGYLIARPLSAEHFARFALAPAD
jgi:EAL domain-containing protein (putative c-di-GMP-specific phosphodiesterase class I)